MAVPADLIYTGGWIFTTRSHTPERMAVAVTDGVITAVVPEADTAALTSPHTQVIDLNGGLLVPGFQDAHIHPVSGGVELLQCNLTEATTADEAVAMIAEYAAANPDLEWIQGAGWSMDHFPGGNPTRDLLDAIVPDRPVLLSSRDHHSTWANTKAFQIAGITAATADPADGRIERESDGTPAGALQEGASELFNEVRPQTSDDLAYQGLLAAQAELFSLGVTGWQDALVGTGFGMTDSLVAYERAIEEGTLLAHVVGSQWWERSAGIEQVQQMIERRDDVAARYPAETLDLGTIKMMVDGVAENQTAAMNVPYRDAHGHDTDNSGLSFIDPELLKHYVTTVDAAGFQVHFHALGDRAVRETLDAVEAAHQTNGSNDNRHHLAHLQVVDSADTPRFAQLDAIANIQSLWGCHETQLDELTLPFLPETSEDHHYPFGELHSQGARLAAGSDWPVSSANPIAAIHIAVNRVSPTSTDRPLGPPSQKLDLATSLTAYTAGSAYVNHRDHDTGAIVPGYLANLAVLEPNPFDLDPSEIYTSTVTSTWVRGTQVYARTN
ncbi:amidohydrolase [Leifsonia kafniensis]|uniref:Amidohydrolase n=1 Tax=Leifsonia kafniensis TaxID=475957 RepID=A0ABP7KZF3_9MICO